MCTHARTARHGTAAASCVCGSRTAHTAGPRTERLLKRIEFAQRLLLPVRRLCCTMRSGIPECASASPKAINWSKPTTEQTVAMLDAEAVRRGAARRGTARHSARRCGAARRGAARQCTARDGTGRQGMARRGWLTECVERSAHLEPPGFGILCTPRLHGRLEPEVLLRCLRQTGCLCAVLHKGDRNALIKAARARAPPASPPPDSTDAKPAVTAGTIRDSVPLDLPWQTSRSAD